MEPKTTFKPRCQLHGHREDVRSICVGEIGIVTSSRDTTLKIWAQESATAYSLLHTLTGDSKYVGAVAYASPGLLVGFPNGAIISGSFDGTVMMWDVASAAAMHTLKGHQYQVTAIAVLPSGDVASASVDKTVKLWHEGKPAGDLLGHDGPVLCLAVTEAGELLSGSGDQTIKRWRDKQCVQTYKGHTDTVRIGFVSASDDRTVKVWWDSGDVLAELLGHTAIVYSVAATPAGIIASGSADNTVRLWSSLGDCLQTIDHPGCVWAVAFTSTGDLVTGSSDAVARVWSVVDERQVGAETAAAYQKFLGDRKSAAAASAQAAAQPGVDVDSATAATAAGLPPGVKITQASELAQQGAKGGEDKIVREADGSVCTYSWDAGACVWQKIGTVVEPGLPTAAGAGSSAAAAIGSSAAIAAGWSAAVARPESPSAVTPASKLTNHPRDDPSPTSAQPAAKQKTGANSAAAAKPWASTAAAAAGTVVGRLPSCSQKEPALHSAADWCYGSNKFLEKELKKRGPAAVLEEGVACSTCMDRLEEAGQLHRVGYTRERSGKDVVYSVLCQLSYTGQKLQPPQWKQQEDNLPSLIPSSAAAGDKELFESGRAYPAVKVQVKFRKGKHGKHWYVHGNGVGVNLQPDRCRAAGHPLEVPSNECFEALFNINVVVLLLWHAEGKQQHPELQHVADIYQLVPKRKPGQKQRPQEAMMTSTAAARAGAVQLLEGLAWPVEDFD